MAILSEVNEFYSKLYSSENCIPELFVDNLLNNTLSQEASDSCEGLLTLDECLHAGVILVG